MLSKPWFQLLLTFIVLNAMQALIILMGQAMQSDVITFLMLAMSCALFTAIITTPHTATTGHKLMAITFAAATIYFGIVTIASAWAMAGFMGAWYAYNHLQNTYALAMQLFTALEIISIFGNAGARMGRIGEHFERGIDYVYSAVFVRMLHRMSHKGI